MPYCLSTHHHDYSTINPDIPTQLIDILIKEHPHKPTWFLAEPCMTTAGLTGRGGTGRTVKIIQSGRANLGSIPKMMLSSLEMFLKISNTRSAERMIFFSCDSSFTSFHSAVNSSPVFFNFG